MPHSTHFLFSIFGVLRSLNEAYQFAQTLQAITAACLAEIVETDRISAARRGYNKATYATVQTIGFSAVYPLQIISV